jgi:hypothetical protein
MTPAIAFACVAFFFAGLIAGVTYERWAAIRREQR